MERLRGTPGFITVTAGLATIVGIAFAAYQLGQSGSNGVAETVKVNVLNSIEHVIASLPEDKKSDAKELLTPVTQLVSAAANEPNEENRGAIDKATNSISETLISKSLVSYHADRSPFVPPVNKVQLLCDEQFVLTYTGQSANSTASSVLKIGTKERSLGTHALSPGDVAPFRSDTVELVITNFEYRMDMKGPVLQYTCKARSG